MTNLILATDSYKQSHFLQYPPEARAISAYIEARPNDFSADVLFMGLQPYLIDSLSRPITAADIDEAEAICIAHGVPFNRAGWEIILHDHAGLLPIEIRALPEGMIVPTGVPLVQVETTDPRLPWLATFIETALLRAIWYPTTVATLTPLVLPFPAPFLASPLGLARFRPAPPPVYNNVFVQLAPRSVLR
jgi:nicotinamide phosphoribosyltransferase